MPSLLSAHLDLLSRDLVLRLRRVGRAGPPGAAAGTRTLLRVVLRTAREKRERRESTEQDDLGLGDVLDSLLTRLDLSWLGPDPEETTEMLEVVLIFVRAMEEEEEEEAEITKERKEEGGGEEEEEEGAVTKLIKGKWRCWPGNEEKGGKEGRTSIRIELFIGGGGG